MENEIRVPGRGLEAWRVENRQQHYGLDAEYVLPIFSKRTLELTVEALRRTNYVSAVRGSQIRSSQIRSAAEEEEENDIPGAYYAWYADRGDWELQLFNDQKNAFQPMAPCEWMRTVSHKLLTEVPSFNDTDRTFGGATGMLVTWCPWPDKGVPCTRSGEHARTWYRRDLSVFMYLSASSPVPGSEGGPVREVVLSPSGHPLAQKHFQSEETGGLAQKSIRFSMVHGSVLILRGAESRCNWDMTHLPSVCVMHGDVADARGDFFLELEPIHAIRYLDEKRIRPPVRDAEGICREIHYTPLFFNYDAKLAPAACVPNEQAPPPPPPPPPPPSKKTEEQKPPTPAKKRKPAKKRAKKVSEPKTGASQE